MSYRNIILTGALCSVFTYSSVVCALHFKSAKQNEILRSSELKVCNNNQCVTLERHQGLPDDFNVKAPLGINYALNKKEVICLAQQLLQEPAKNNDIDRAAVAHATINRVKDKEYPNTICKVISYKRYTNHKISYDMSWYGNLKKRKMKPRNSDIQFAKQVLLGNVKNPIGKATNWYNITHDNPNSFNGKEYRKTKNAAFKFGWNTTHFY